MRRFNHRRAGIDEELEFLDKQMDDTRDRMTIKAEQFRVTYKAFLQQGSKILEELEGLYDDYEGDAALLIAEVDHLERKFKALKTLTSSLWNQLIRTEELLDPEFELLNTLEDKYDDLWDRKKSLSKTPEALDYESLVD